MVKYTEVHLDTNSLYQIGMLPSFSGSVPYFEKTRRNALNMLAEGRPVTIVVPERSIDAKEKEQYRSFFCKYAKQNKRNCIYFEGPVSIVNVGSR